MKLDLIDHKILQLFTENTRVPFTKIAKVLNVSIGTVHVRVKKLEDTGVITGSSLNLDYLKLGFPLTAYVGVHLQRTSRQDTELVIKELRKIPHITVAHITIGPYNIFCKIRARDTFHVKNIIFQIDAMDGVLRTESFISLGEEFNDNTRLLNEKFKEQTD